MFGFLVLRSKDANEEKGLAFVPGKTNALAITGAGRNRSLVLNNLRS